MARIGQARASLAATLAESIVIAASAPRPYRRVFGRVRHRFSRLSMIIKISSEYDTRSHDTSSHVRDTLTTEHRLAECTRRVRAVARPGDPASRPRAHVDQLRDARVQRPVGRQRHARAAGDDDLGEREHRVVHDGHAVEAEVGRLHRERLSARHPLQPRQLGRRVGRRGGASGEGATSRLRVVALGSGPGSGLGLGLVARAPPRVPAGRRAPTA